MTDCLLCRAAELPKQPSAMAILGRTQLGFREHHHSGRSKQENTGGSRSGQGDQTPARNSLTRRSALPRPACRFESISACIATPDGVRPAALFTTTQQIA